MVAGKDPSTTRNRAVRRRACSFEAHRFLFQKDVRTLLRGIFLDDLRSEGEDLRVLGVHRRANPVHVVLAESLDSGEVQDSAILLALFGVEWFVDPEVVGVAVNQHDRPAEGDYLLPEGFLEVGEARGVLRIVFEGVGLDREHHCGMVVLPGRFEGLLQPGEVGLVARGVLVRVVIGVERVVAAHDVQRREGDVAVAPARVLRVVLALACQPYAVLAEQLVAAKESLT
jgi:hypothetical protein